MRAVVIDGPGRVGCREVPDPVPGQGEIVVTVRAAGICGTDLHLLAGDLPYDHFPLIPGHEFCGEVAAVGPDVDEAWVGRLVVCDPNLPCGECEECRRGRSNLCERYEALGVTLEGAAAEFVRVPVDRAYALPPGMDLDAAVLIEPLACAVHGLDLLPRRPGDRHLIYGAGPMGVLMAMLVTEVAGEPVVMIEPDDTRRELARELGFTVARSGTDLDPNDRFDAVVDCTGAVPAIEDGLGRVRRGGVMMLFGVAARDATARFSPFDVYRNEITIIGSMAVHHSFDRAVRIAERWGPRLASIVTHRFSLDDYASAVDVVTAGAGLKVVLVPAAS